MGLEIIGNTLLELVQSGYSFTDKEKTFVVEFAYNTNDKELTDKLISELSVSADVADSDRIIHRFSILYDQKPAWVIASENLLVAMELLIVQEVRFMDALSDRIETAGLDKCVEETEKLITETNKGDKIAGR